MTSIDELRKIIDTSRKIVFFGGAGVSTESNIPDFRSEEGLYQAKEEYGRSPETLISHSFFRSQPEMFFDYYKNKMIYPEAKPNKAHLALAQLEKAGNLIGIVTQNIDGLHQLAGSKNVVELHGSVHRNYCMDCKAYYDLAYILDPTNCGDKSGAKAHVPYCSKCGGMVKPDVVLYEESLNEEDIERGIEWISMADTMIVGGTSLLVHPAAGLLRYFKGDNLVLINKTPTSYDSKASWVSHDAIGSVLGPLMNTP
jgi:NAD-dependent deacetylase